MPSTLFETETLTCHVIQQNRQSMSFREVSCMHLPSPHRKAGVRVMFYFTQLYMSYGDLKPVPHSYSASALPTEPSPQGLLYNLMIAFIGTEVYLHKNLYINSSQTESRPLWEMNDIFTGIIFDRQKTKIFSL